MRREILTLDNEYGIRRLRDKGNVPVCMTKDMFWSRYQIYLDLCDSVGDNFGLAAPQIEYPRRAFFINTPEFRRICFNPYFIIPFHSTKETSYEGCLSIPGRGFQCQRYIETGMKFVYQNIKGEWVVEPAPTRRAAFVYQHEFDHLQGVLISDHGKEM